MRGLVADRPLYMRPAPETATAHVLVGRGFPKEYEHADPDGYDEGVDAAFERDVHERVAGTAAAARRDAPASTAASGLYDVTPDWHPLLGPVAGVEGLHLATGGAATASSSGPRSASCRAARARPRLEYADVATFSRRRFAEGRELARPTGATGLTS